MELRKDTESFIFAEKGGTVYRIRADAKEVIGEYTIDNFNSSGFEIDNRDNSLYATGQEKTAYLTDTSDELKAGDNSLNIYDDPLDIAVDGTRNSFWQIDRTQICLKKLNGETIFCLSLPEEIDVDYSSSSSSSSSTSSESELNTSSSSSSSEEYVVTELS